MKKIIVLALIALTALTSYAGSYDWDGSGVYNIAVTTTPQFIIVPGTNYCYAVSVVETGGTTDIFWEKVGYGTTTALVATNGFVATNALSTAAGKSYTSAGGTVSNEKNRRQIGGIVISTSSGTATANVNFE